jgi:S-adenosylmethionine-dependent methyltransferase
MSRDRSFDDLADKFEKKVYGGLKGRIRLAILQRDLDGVLPGIWRKVATPLRVLDIGGGLGQLSIELAKAGHVVAINDISPNMLAKAQRQASEVGVDAKIDWLCGPYQYLPDQLKGKKFDLVLCHALMEWLAEPSELIPRIKPLLAGSGHLSLTFYNRCALVYRNLIRGNFRLLDSEQLRGDEGSLTPGNPQMPDMVTGLIEDAALRIVARSGIRVFNDYVQVPRGGNETPDEILRMELRYSTQDPYLWLGRYIHFICKVQGD